MAATAVPDVRAYYELHRRLVEQAEWRGYRFPLTLLLELTRLGNSVRLLLGECEGQAGGDLVILNFSYRGSLVRDRSDLHDVAELCGLGVLVDGEHPFTHWDGTAFHLRRR